MDAAQLHLPIPTHHRVVCSSAQRTRLPPPNRPAQPTSSADGWLSTPARWIQPKPHLPIPRLLRAVCCTPKRSRHHSSPLWFPPHSRTGAVLNGAIWPGSFARRMQPRLHLPVSTTPPPCNFPPPPLAVVEETLLEMWKSQKASLQRIAPNVSHLQCHPIAEVIDAPNQNIAIRLVEGVAGAYCI